MAKQMLQGCEVLELDKDPERGLLEIRDGKFWDGEPAHLNGTPVLDGFYFVELAPDAPRILNNELYGPYADAVEAEIAARDSYTLTDFKRAFAQLEREGRIRRVVGEDGVPRYQAIGPRLSREVSENSDSEAIAHAVRGVIARR
jgi:hypothetical protein